MTVVLRQSFNWNIYVSFNVQGEVQLEIYSVNQSNHFVTGLYARTIALKNKNPDLKVLLAVGGWQIGSKPFIPMISNEHNRRTWVKNVVNYLRSYVTLSFVPVGI